MSLTRTWSEQLKAKLQKGKDTARYSKKYAHAFPSSYQEDFSIETAIDDIKRIENLTPQHPLEVDLYEQSKNNNKRFYVKLLQLDKPIPLSDILPILENMGLRTFNERPYRIVLNNKIIWISDFSVTTTLPTEPDIHKIKKIFHDALINISTGICENDGFNKLIIGAQLDWREAMILRAYAKYLLQIGIRYSQSYLDKTLAHYPHISRNLVNLFNIKFDPVHKTANTKAFKLIENKIITSLETVTSLDEDRILRYFLQLIKATLRTNYFQAKEYISYKLASAEVPDLPLPRPLYEVFVYSPRFEAIHLRNSKVARGGIRWSDRREDFRTEILALMKAQKVKNAIIVPSGAKGGFVLKMAVADTSREALMAEVIYCYKSFMRGLLDITDNLKNGKVIRPSQVICYDDEDTYLVVAADKGTATFSDIANEISNEYDFWLGDAFASGGSAGYDHKKMGITARGAWESIKRHFHSIHINIDTSEFNVVGIGDMSGDVFGNGMLYSDHIRLIAAFDHRDIFIDPNPNAKKSFLERKRLFKLPVSSWQDYNRKCISKGGGVFSRKTKSITLTPEIKKALAIEENSLTPNELIRAILKAPVDLLFNGGIGTYVKATSESHADVGDKSNEFCRVNGNDLRCRIVGEGGNLGFTQLGRVEYALNGGLINTDFIDNSAGVDCSDHEVNIKILLNHEVKKKKLTEKKRNHILSHLTNEVAERVLRDNFNQALALGFTVNHSVKYMNLYINYLKDLETTGVINRAVECLPDDKKMAERKAAGKGLTSPELAVLLAYTKIFLKQEILKSEIPDDSYFDPILKTAFPATLCQIYNDSLKKHSLRREIIATQLSNRLVNEMGITFVYRIQLETGAATRDVIRAYTAATCIFDTEELENLIDSLEAKIPADLQYELLHYIRNLTTLATRWFLHGARLQGSLDKIIHHYSERVKKLLHILPDLMSGVTKTFLDSLKERFHQLNISEKTGNRIALTRAIYTALNIIEVSTQHRFDLIETAKLYFDVGSTFNLVWFRDQIAADNREGHWNSLARLTLRDELDILQKLLTIKIMKSSKNNWGPKQLIDHWLKKNKRAIERWEKILEMLYGVTTVEYSMFFIAIRELSNWIVSGDK